jgi:hypothetical protein
MVLRLILKNPKQKQLLNFSKKILAPSLLLLPAAR